MKLQRRMNALVLGLGLVAGLGGVALAQVSSKGGPVMIGSDKFTADQNNLTQYLDGRVQISQTDSRLQADNVKIIHAPGEGGSGFGEVVTIEAKGNVFYVTPQETVKGDMAVYTASTDTMVITGDVILTQGKNVMTGNRLVIEIKAEKTTMDAQQSSISKGRVRGVFYPKDEK